jgi:hypothetical protein
MYVLYVCVCESEREREFVCMYVCIGLLGQISSSPCMNGVKSTRKRGMYGMHVCVCICVCVCGLFVCMYVCMYACMYRFAATDPL